MNLKQYEFLNPNVRGLFVHWQSPIKICIQLWKHGFVSKSIIVSPWKKVGGLQGKSEKRSGAFASNNTIPACIHDVHRIYYSYGTEPITVTRKLPVNTDNSLPGCLGIIVTCTCTVLLYFCCDRRQIWLFFKEIVSL